LSEEVLLLRFRKQEISGGVYPPVTQVPNRKYERYTSGIMTRRWPSQGTIWINSCG
jgi:hypothetical protein